MLLFSELWKSMGKKGKPWSIPAVLKKPNMSGIPVHNFLHIIKMESFFCKGQLSTLPEVFQFLLSIFEVPLGIKSKMGRMKTEELQ